ncbi:MAG: hypothetical protein ACRD3W_28120 [Terriglobales bacterium]
MSTTDATNTADGQISIFQRNRWRTIWTDGCSTRYFDALIALSDCRFYELRTKRTSTAKAHRCSEGQVRCRYTVEKLEAVPICGGRNRVIWQSPESRYLDFCRCQSLSEQECIGSKLDSEDSSAFSIQAILEDNISIDSLTDEYNIAASNPHGGRRWHTMRLDGARLRKQRLPRHLIEKADAAFAALASQSESLHDYYPSYFPTDGYLLKPAKTGIAVEFQCDYRLDPFDASLFCLRLENGDGAINSDQSRRSQFREQNSKLLPWDSIDTFTVAPDGASVLYTLSGELFWASAAGSIVSLGPISRLGGWQWVDTGKLAGRDRAWISNPEHALAC